MAFSVEVFSLDTLKKAAYRMSDVAVIDIAPSGENIICTMKFRQPLSAEDVDQAVSTFKLEVLDQDLRASIGTETDAMRNAILALAFSKSGLSG